MSKFIQEENQRLLWNVSQKLPNIRDIFPNVTEQGNWFKDVIQHFYEKRKREHLSKVELENLNKQTIQYMIDFMKHKKIARQDDGIKRVTFGVEPLDHQVNTPFTELMGSNNNILITPRPQAIIGEPRIVSTNILEERQREYENMLKREVPAEPNFHELEKDTVIENMEELMQQQLRERELLYLPNSNVFPTEPKTDQLSGPNLTPKVASLPEEFEAKLRIARNTSRKLKIQDDLLPDESNGVVQLESNPVPILINTSLLMDLLLEIKNEVRELRNIVVPRSNQIVDPGSPNSSTIKLVPELGDFSEESSTAGF